DQEFPETIELIDLNISTSYYPDDYHTSKNDDRDFSNILFDLEVIPYEFTQARWQMDYDPYEGYLMSSYLDFTFFNEEKWSVGVGHRYNRESSNLIAFELDWQINQEWFLKFYQRFAANDGKLQEQEYSIIRNLHCWNVALSFIERPLRDEKIFWVTFYLKDLPGESQVSRTLYNSLDKS
ncbi:hypothetical protein ACFLQ1_02550, partial [Candidatus Auribacterota bacterium]